MSISAHDLYSRTVDTREDDDCDITTYPERWEEDNVDTSRQILIDNRSGSKNLLHYFDTRLALLTHLEYADFAFVGNGPNDVPVFVGVERKEIGDFVASITSGRLAGHQLPGLIKSYNFIYIVVEGLWRSNPRDGSLEVYRSRQWLPLGNGKGFMGSGVWNTMNSIQIFTPARVFRTRNQRETVDLVMSLYKWFQKDFDKHQSHAALHVPQHTVEFSEPSPLRMVAAALPGIGGGRSKDAANHFKSIKEMIEAPAKEWMKIKGIGKRTADKVTQIIQGEE